MFYALINVKFAMRRQRRSGVVIVNSKLKHCSRVSLVDLYK